MRELIPRIRDSTKIGLNNPIFFLKKFKITRTTTEEKTCAA